MNGWIKLHRSLIDWEWYEDHATTRLWIHLLLTCNHEPKKWRGITIEKGQRVCGFRKLAQESGLSLQVVRTSIKRLKSTHELTQESTHIGTLLTLCNWDKYQSSDSSSNTPNNTRTNIPSTHDQHTINTKQEGKKVRREESKSKAAPFDPPAGENPPSLRMRLCALFNHRDERPKDPKVNRAWKNAQAEITEADVKLVEEYYAMRSNPPPFYVVRYALPQLLNNWASDVERIRLLNAETQRKTKPATLESYVLGGANASYESLADLILR